MQSQTPQIGTVNHYVETNQLRYIPLEYIYETLYAYLDEFCERMTLKPLGPARLIKELIKLNGWRTDLMWFRLTVPLGENDS